MLNVGPYEKENRSNIAVKITFCTETHKYVKGKWNYELKIDIQK